MTTTSFGCTMCSSRIRNGRASSSSLVRELEAVRPVDRERVDVQPLERLEERLAGAPEEGDALLDLSRLRAVLQQEDVGPRVPRAQDRHTLALAGGGDLVAELVDLGDRLLEVLLVDLVGGHWSSQAGSFPVLV